MRALIGLVVFVTALVLFLVFLMGLAGVLQMMLGWH